MNMLRINVFLQKQIFRAIELTPFEEVEVVIIGQDPYHNDFQANGLCFSVSDQVKAPPSLKNIFTELKDDLGIVKTSNELDSWAKQGVLLLNATLRFVLTNRILTKIWAGKNSQILSSKKFRIKKKM
jgi:uracil-DNA glycosylase